MTRCLVFLFLFTAGLSAASAQSKKDRKAVAQIRADVEYLASDALDGRRTGTAGERAAAAYLEGRYGKLGIAPYRGKYSHAFTYTAGYEIDSVATSVRIDGEGLVLGRDAFPLPASATGSVGGDAIPEVMEQANVWLLPLYGSSDDAQNVHFDWEANAHTRAEEAAKLGATAVVFYDAYGGRAEPAFNTRSESKPLSIPAFVLTHTYTAAHLADLHASHTVALSASVKKAQRSAANVAAYLDNGAPYTIVLGAHYDHLGHGEDGNSTSPEGAKQRLIHNGADDNASGTAGLLHLAARLKKSKAKSYNYLFLHFSGEELGLLGSKAAVKDFGLDSTRVAAMINMDMIGRLVDSSRALTVGGVGTSPVWGGVLDKISSGFRIVKDSSGVGPSDHTSFYNAGVPVLFFFTGIHSDYHKPSDDAEKLNYAGELQVLNVVYAAVEEVARGPRPRFTATKQTAMGRVRFKVTLGIMPDYAYADRGVKVDGVTEGKPAQKAGVKAGDIITALGDKEVGGMQSYMEALGSFKEGDKTTITILRGAGEIKLPVEFR